MLPAGTVLGQRYPLLEKIGEGSAAVVYRAEDLRLGRDVAVKVLRPAYAADPEQAARFEQEARAAAGLAAPNIVDVYDYGRDAGAIYLVMQYVAGENLRQYLQRRGPLPPVEAARVALAVSRGLEAAHAHGIIHRDVKPQNILIDRQGQVRLTDFGIAKALGGPGLTRVGMTYGTAAYLAPEQATGDPLGPPTDVYALGIVLFEMLCGQAPFRAENAAAVAYQQVYAAPPPLEGCAPATPPALAAIVTRALAKDPAQRYPSATALAAALESFLQQPTAPAATPSAPLRAYTPVTPTAPTAPYPAPPPPPAQPTLRPGRWIAIPLIALVLLAGLIGARFMGAGPEPPTPGPGGVLPPSATAAPTGLPAVLASATAAPSPLPPTPAPPAPTAAPPPPSATAVPPSATPAPPAPPSDTPAPPATPAPSGGGGNGRPVFDTPTPPTGAQGHVALEDVAFTGGYRYPPPSVYDGRTAVWVYGQGTAFATMTAPFLVPNQPSGTAQLRIVGLDSEGAQKTPLRLLINGQVIFNGADPLPNDYSPNQGNWGSATWTFPATLLQPGSNTLTVENLSPSSNLGIPFIMVDSAELTWPPSG